jgi:FkbM family methyltransferase
MFTKTLIKLARIFDIDLKRYQGSDYNRLITAIKDQEIDIIMDVGANQGQYAEFIRTLGYAGEIVSFEPLSSAHKLIKKKSEKDPLWTVAERMAIGSKDEESKINISENSVSSSILSVLDAHLVLAPKSSVVSTEPVSIRRIDSIAEQYLNPESNMFIKIDVQGFERNVLQGATKTLSMAKGVQVEVSLLPMYENEASFEEILFLMKEMNYCLYNLIPGFSNLQNGRLIQVDCIFLRNI